MARRIPLHGEIYSRAANQAGRKYGLTVLALTLAGAFLPIQFCYISCTFLFN